MMAPFLEALGAALETAAEGAAEAEAVEAVEELEDGIDLPDDSGDRVYHSELPDDSGEKIPENCEKNMDVPAECNFKGPDGCNKAEFIRQVKAQENGLNNMTVGQFLKNRENYNQNGRDVKDGAEAQQRVRQEARANKIAELRDNGLSRIDAEKQADEWLKTQAALHDPDQIAGGDPKNVTGMGDSNVNSSIGAQWGPGNQAARLERQVRDYIKKNEIPPAEWNKIQMKVHLSVIN